MEVGTMVMNAFYVILANPDVMIALLTFTVIITLLLSTFEMKGAR